jgi:imidazolonepropionase-like amidohydrolase
MIFLLSSNLLAVDMFVLIRGGKILTMTKGILLNTDILIKNGKIIEIADKIKKPEGAIVINATDKIVMPGMIDLHSHIGTMGASWKDQDSNEQSGPSTPQVSIADSINPYHEDFRNALSGGVTTVLISPGSGNVIGGKDVLLKCYGTSLEKMIIKRESGMKFGIYNKAYPSTMMGINAFLRETLKKTQEYANAVKAWEDSGKNGPDPRNSTMEDLSKVLRGELVARMHVESAREIMTAIHIAQEFNLKLELIHAIDAYKVIDEISQRHIPVLYGPLHPAMGTDSYKSPALLDQAGVKLCLVTDSPVYPEKHLRYQAIFAAKYGMKKENVLKAVTLNPAEIVGVADRLGSIEIGKDADLVIWDNDPLDIRSKVEKVLVNGEICYEKPLK